MSEHRGESEPRARIRMTGRERREQLVQVGRALFAERGFDGTSIEEIAARAKVSKPVVYEHFGGKEGLYAVVVDREMSDLLDRLTRVLSAGQHPRELVEQAALSLLTYIEEEADGFRILSRDSTSGAFSSLLNDVATQVEYVLVREFGERGISTKYAAMYAQMLVGMVSVTGTWWLEERKQKREEVAAHLVNLGWNGLAHLEPKPRPIPRRPGESVPDRLPR
jgi:AcrR family transcriptional regulator